MSDTSSSLFSGPQGKVWYLLYCKAKEEGRAVMHLANQGIDAFYPKANITKVLRGKRQTVEEALFPNYVFAQLDHDVHNFTSVRSTRGVIGFVKQGKDYQKVSQALIDVFVQCDTVDKLDSALPTKGDNVMLQHPQYQNIPAIYQEPKGENRAILLIHLLNKPVELVVDNSQFTKKD
ncbi:transcription/translation regulatory transformer protein RfaH [Glaciecola sp. HTCC2999]|uniref:transcription/translation regulatory transformer protein RfaH n=1 Tax=Glaciecola sp. HTCC2999 TaxID=455436 RepID=UPI0000E0F5F6|nr:transcription/translation regulatory transformer protein RfaH [Glaciecola sp. HTCC2999]